MKELKGKVAVVTGAASGIGRATAAELAREGCELALCDVDEKGLAEVCDELRELGTRVSSQVVDVASRDQMTAFAEATVQAHGRVHIVVNNAGVAIAESIEDARWEDIEWLVGINFWGVLHGCKIFLPHLKSAGEGHIVNISSLFGLLGLPKQGPYCATKAAVRSLSETLHGELKGTGIGVTSVHPGGIRTNIVKNARMRDETQRADAVAFFEKRPTTPEAVARRIVSAIRRDRLRLLVTPETVLADWAKRIAPVWTQRLVRRFWPDEAVL